MLLLSKDKELRVSFTPRNASLSNPCKLLVSKFNAVRDSKVLNEPAKKIVNQTYLLC